MAGPKIEVVKRVLIYDIWVEADDAGRDLLDKIQQNTKPIAERVGDWVSGVRDRCQQQGLPDPLRDVLVDEQGGWRYQKGNEENALPGHVFIVATHSKEDPAAIEMAIMRHAVGFLDAKDCGDFDRAHEELNKFSEMHANFWAELDAKEDIERGRKSPRDGSVGGRMTSAANAPHRASVRAKMEELVAQEHTVSRAAELAFKAGYGKSAVANRQAWYRKKKR